MGAGFYESASHFDTGPGGIGPNPLRDLIDSGADIDRADRDGMTLLHYACREGHLKAVQMLLEAGAALEKQDRDARTPLHLACFMARRGLSRGTEHIDISTYLQQHGASTAAQDFSGHTPLSYLPRGDKLVGLNTPAVNGVGGYWATTVVDPKSKVRRPPPRNCLALFSTHAPCCAVLAGAGRRGRAVRGHPRRSLECP